MLHSGSAVRRSRDRIGRSITILMVAMPLYCKSLEFQFETKLCIFQNISKYFFEKIPHVLPSVQYDDNQADITKMLNIGDDPAERDFGRVPPRHRTCGLIPETCVCRVRGHAKETARFSKHNRWRSKEMQSAGLCGPQLSFCCSQVVEVKKCSPQNCAGRSLRRAEVRNSLFVRLRPPHAATRKHFINTHASASPAAEAISEKGWPRRRSVKNR